MGKVKSRVPRALKIKLILRLLLETRTNINLSQTLSLV